jgi:RNA polymerase sigma factor (TIGR02999 family)
MGDGGPRDVTRLIAAVGGGEGAAAAAAELMELVYGELRQAARRQMAGVPPGDTLQPTALVHEVYLQLFGGDGPGWESRAHFFYAAARAMRDIVIGQARKHAAAKRGGGRRRIILDEQLLSFEEPAEDLVALDEALHELEQADATGARIVMLRYFAGLTVPETARAMDVSPSTVDRHWRYARAWLHRRIHAEEPEDERNP